MTGLLSGPEDPSTCPQTAWERPHVATVGLEKGQRTVFLLWPGRSFVRVVCLAHDWNDGICPLRRCLAVSHVLNPIILYWAATDYTWMYFAELYCCVWAFCLSEEDEEEVEERIYYSTGDQEMKMKKKQK